MQPLSLKSPAAAILKSSTAGVKGLAPLQLSAQLCFLEDRLLVNVILLQYRDLM